MRTRLFGCLLVLAGVSAAQDSNFAVGPQYLMNYGSPIFARPIATPSLSLDSSSLDRSGKASETTAQNVVAREENEMVPAIPEFLPQADLFPIYYGAPSVSFISLNFPEPSEKSTSLHPLPVNLIESGVVEITDMQSLRLRGYGVTLPEAAAYWKAHHVPQSRVYTNADTERMRTRD